jgi:hypothetical protein
VSRNMVTIRKRYHGIWHPEDECQDIFLPDAACQGICLPDAKCHGK